ncbi:hypothetical protein QOZ80_3AG0209870 [Eleusine coracana subsp. coracana]|nr:hypothetical protein QOZ80_3AG0209870 [Eleusine coracana subsp. coracana]
MSGWNSTVLDDARKVRRMRNRSLTKEEVDAFWRQHGRPDTSSHHHQGSPLGSPRVVVSPRRSDELQQEMIPPFEARRLDAIRSLPSSPLARGAGSPSSHGGHQQQFSSARSEPPSSPAAARAEEGLPESGGGAADSLPSTSCDWWTRSNWAFLNEPPHTNKHEEASMSGRGRAHKGYALDQFDAARIVTGNA